MRKLQFKRSTLFIIIALVVSSATFAQQKDSTLVVKTLTEMKGLQTKKSGAELFLQIARCFKGFPYVGHTLDRTDDEQLVVNLYEIDCTTFLENALALTLCVKAGETDFASFKKHLQDIRYRNGQLAYENRLHYYQWWVTDNAQMGYVKEIDHPNPPFTAVQKLKINYMSSNPNLYDMLRHHPERVAALKTIEDATNGTAVRYIPKELVKNTQLLRETIHDGDILALVTNKKNLDTTHLGIAVWKSNGLHLLNASSIHKKVVEEPMLLYDYLARRQYLIGIRVARVL